MCSATRAEPAPVPPAPLGMLINLWRVQRSLQSKHLPLCMHSGLRPNLVVSEQHQFKGQAPQPITAVIQGLFSGLDTPTAAKRACRRKEIYVQTCAGVSSPSIRSACEHVCLSVGRCLLNPLSYSSSFIRGVARAVGPPQLALFSALSWTVVLISLPCTPLLVLAAMIATTAMTAIMGRQWHSAKPLCHVIS
jgi:hypothetical protein